MLPHVLQQSVLSQAVCAAAALSQALLPAARPHAAKAKATATASAAAAAPRRRARPAPSSTTSPQQHADAQPAPPLPPPPPAAAAAAYSASRARVLTVASAAALPAALQDSEEAQHKHAALDDTIKRLNKKLGTGTLVRLGEQPASTRSGFDCLPSGCLTLDVALGGGWARGRIVEVFGPESSGKTTLALHAIAEAQRAGGQAVFVDAEHAFNKPFAEALGVNVNELIMCQPSCGEDALEVVDQVLRSHAVDFVAVDSVSALLPRAELEGAMGELQVAGQARLMSHGLRKLAANAAKTHSTVMFINQLRHRVGVLYGNPETTSGGQALKFYASQRVDVRMKERIKGPSSSGGSEGAASVETGVRVKAKVVKNKVAPPYKSAEFVIAFNRGIDANETLLEASLACGLVQARGSHYYWGAQRLGHGRDSAAAVLAADAGLRAQLTRGVREAMQQDSSVGAAGAIADGASGGSSSSSSAEAEPMLAPA